MSSSFGAEAQGSVITAERENPAEAAGTTDPKPLPDTPTEQPKPLVFMDFSSLQKDAEAPPPSTDPDKSSILDKSSEHATPKTGDDNNMALWIGLLLASVIGMGGCVCGIKRKKHKMAHLKNTEQRERTALNRR